MNIVIFKNIVSVTWKGLKQNFTNALNVEPYKLIYTDWRSSIFT